MNKKKQYITKNNRDALIAKANALVNQGLSLKRILQRCRISYRQLLRLSRDEAWVWNDNSLLFNNRYDSNVWCSHALTQLNRNFAIRGHALGLSKKHLAFLLGRSERTIQRYLARKNR